MSTLVFPGKLRTEKGCAWAESLISVHHTVFIYCFVYGLPRHYMLINSSPHLKAMTISTQKALACLGNHTKMAILQFPRSHFFFVFCQQHETITNIPSSSSSYCCPQYRFINLKVRTLNTKP